MNPHTAGQLPLDFSVSPASGRGSTRPPLPYGRGSTRPPLSPTPVADRRRAHDRARQERHAAARREIAEAYLFECANRERLRLPQITVAEFEDTRAWLGF